MSVEEVILFRPSNTQKVYSENTGHKEKEKFYRNHAGMRWCTSPEKVSVKYAKSLPTKLFFCHFPNRNIFNFGQTECLCG